MSLVLTIDVGSTNMKGLVINNEGKVVERRIHEITLYLENRFAGHEPKELLESFTFMLDYFGKKYGRSIEAISVTTYNHSMLLVEKDGTPLTKVITHHDTRAAEVEKELLEKANPYELYEETGAPPIFVFMPYRLYWFMKKEPSAFKEARYFLFCKDYLLWKTGLTTEPYIDLATASGGGIVNIRKLKYSEKVLNLLGIDENRFPRLCEGGKIFDTIPLKVCGEYGFNPDAKIVFATFDGAAQNFGLGLTEKGTVLSIGSTGVIRKLSRKVVLDKSLEMRFFTYYAANGFYALGGASNSGGDCLRWFRDNFGQMETIIGSSICKDPYSILDLEAEKALPGSEGLIFLPFLTGERFPYRDPNLTGAFLGISRRCGRAHFIRSIMEGVGYVVRAIADALSENSISLDEIYLVGGGSKSRLWAQILSDILGSEINVVATGEDATNYGAAALAFNALSLSSIEEFSNKWVNVREKVVPIEKNRMVYEENYAAFVELVKLLRSVGRKNIRKT
ncbi:MAG: FGGY family carbohydrate kinase [Crenarchaeota archaeon]|nr:FGGY family carbohydrate kinase [Thermoproteota archaeon]